MALKIVIILIVSLHCVIAESGNEDIPVTSLSIGSPPRKIVCQKEHEKCEYGCYDPSIHICLKGKICKKEEQLCINKYRNTCYNPTEQDCVATGRGKGYDAVCPKGHLRCPKDWDCYDPSKETCSSEGKVCPIGEETCGWKCYNPGNKQCLNGHICETGESICGSDCYTPHLQLECVDNHLCEPGLKSCGGRGCYNPTEQDCVATGRGYDAVCPKGHLRCLLGYDCYDPTKEACTSEGRSCPIGEESCGWRCYKPGEKQCLNQELCEIGESICGSECYTPSSDKECVGNYLCEKSQKSCGYHGCYNPTESTCYEDPFVLCKKEEKKCGYECYDPNTEKCFNDYKVCRSTREPCEVYDCYWPHNETCYTGRKGYSPSSCPNDRKACGYDCYEEGKAVCLNYNDYFEMLCKVGEEVCGSRCFNKESGGKCFKDHILCDTDEEVCGRKCYNPNSLPAMTCHDDTALCGDGESPCGEECFNPETEKCVEVKGRYKYGRKPLQHVEFTN